MSTNARDALTREDIFRILRENNAVLDRFAVRRIGLFGSYAKDRQRPASDIDLLVEFDRPSYDNFAGLQDTLERLFGRRVEILTPDGLSGIRVARVADSIRETIVYG